MEMMSSSTLRFFAFEDALNTCSDITKMEMSVVKPG